MYNTDIADISPPPTKPPRGVKQGKETSGLLMSVIRTLSASETNEQREKERAKLEKEYKKSDARLDELVAAHSQEIMDVMQKFSNVTTALTVWGQHCDATVARLAACRGLLQLRREDLRRLWADARTHHYALQMLTDIERVVVSERETRELIAAGRVLGAAHTLRAALDTAANTLSHVDALNATRQHLEAKKKELVEVIVRRMSEAVYRGERSPLARRESARRRTALLLAELTKSEEVTDAYLQDITPEFESSLSEDDKTFETTIMISLEALGVLDQLKEATEKFKVQIQNELLDVINSVSRRIIDEGDVDPDVDSDEDGEDIQELEGVPEGGRSLARLVASLVEEFGACATRNKRLLQLWRAALQRHKLPDSSLHTEQHYWSAVQQVLQLLLTESGECSLRAFLTDYVRTGESERLASVARAAIESAARSPRPGGAPPRRPGSRQGVIFTCCMEGWQGVVDAALAARRCGPFGGVDALRATTGALARWRRSAAPRTRAWRAAATRAPPSGWATTTSCASCRRCPRGAPRRPRPPGTAPCGLLLLATQCRAAHARLAGGGTRAPPSGWATTTSCASCRRCPRGAPRRPRPRRYRALRPPPTGDAVPRRARAPGGRRPRARAKWLGDDIVRFLQALPTWRAAPPAAARYRALRPSSYWRRSAAPRTRAWPGGGHARAAKWLGDDDIVRFLQALPTWRAAPPAARQELEEAYEREAEILGSSLGDGAVTKREIITDTNVLADLALLSESMDWLSANIKTLPSLVGGPNGLRLTDKFTNDINSAAMIFEEISHKCLLFLHLESSTHYGSASSASSASTTWGRRTAAREARGVGVEAVGGGGGRGWRRAARRRLARALLCFHEHAVKILSPDALAYVFGGLGEMMSAGVVNYSVSARERRAVLRAGVPQRTKSDRRPARRPRPPSCARCCRQLSAALGHVGVIV
ncbi:hypothetical protein ACJJTC_005470 [Scirpophaga incertulas]